MSKEPNIMAKMSLMALNYLTSRLSRIQQSLDPRRNIWTECGWPEDEIRVETYQRKYETNPFAARVVEVFPEQCWQVQPEVYENEDPRRRTPFEIDWANLPKNLQTKPNYFNSPKGNPIWEILKRADKLSGIGRYGIILLGLDDGKELSEPAEPREGQKLTFCRVFPENYARIDTFVDDETDPRNGFPETYKVSFVKPNSSTSTGFTTYDKDVHHTRVVHIADNLQSSEYIGLPRQRPVFNNILDLEKLYGGSAEMYWKGAFPGIGFEGLPELMKGAKFNEEDMKQEIEDFMNGLQRYYAIVGARARVLAPAVVDPTPQIKVQIQGICVKLNIPNRVFMGSERGELSSGQDDASWNDILRERHHNYLSPRVISPFANHLIWLKVLREPASYEIAWPDLTSQTPQDKAHVSFELSQSLAQYANSRAPELIGLSKFLTLILGMSERDAMAIEKDTDKRKPEPKPPVATAVGKKVQGSQDTNPNGAKTSA